MNITIVGSPIFHVGVDIATVELLIQCSEAHYDSVCREAACPAGFLFGWRNLLSWEIKYPDPTAVTGPRPTATFRELDRTLKICEVANYLFSQAPEKRQAIHEYQMAIRAALERANNIIDWRIEL